MRSSYSTPSAFIAATASPRALNQLGRQHRARVVERRLDHGQHVERVGPATSGRAARMAASANGESGWLSAKSSCRSTVSADPAALVVGHREPLDHTAGQQRAVDGDGAADVPRAGRAAVSWLSVSSCCIAAKASPGRSITFSSIAWLTPKLDRSGSGCGRDEPVERRLAPGHDAFGRLAAHDLAPLLRVVAGLGQGLLVVDDVLGCLPRPRPGGVEPGAPGAARDLVELACAQQPRACVPSYLDSAVNSTVRIGTLMPTPRVSVPQMTFSSPACASRLDEAPVLGQHAGVVHADAVADQPGQGPAEARREPEIRRSARRSRPSRPGCTR